MPRYSSRPFQLLIVLIALHWCPNAIAEIYKWVDANGKTHYSQTPPTGNTTAAEQITVDSDALGTTGLRPRRGAGGHWHCGDREIQTSANPVEEIAYFNKMIVVWRRELSRAKDKYRRFLRRTTGQTRTSATRAKYQKEIDEYGCMIRLAENRDASLADSKESYRDQLATVRQKLRTLAERKARTCERELAEQDPRDHQPVYHQCLWRFEEEKHRLMAQERRLAQHEKILD